MTTEISTVSFADVATVLSTTNRAGSRVSFEASIAFASKDSRLMLSAKTYAVAVEHGRYAGLIRDALDAGLMTKDAAGIVADMLGAARNPSKEVTVSVCNVILGRVAGKALKGKKAFYADLIRRLYDSLTGTRTPASADVVETAQA